MNNIEELFRKVNKEKILIEGHKTGLKNYLLNSEYFNEREVFDYKPVFASVFFSLIIISASFLFFNNDNEKEIALDNNQRALGVQSEYFNESMKMMSATSDTPIEESITLYDKLISKDNTEAYDSVFDEKEVKVLEVFENSIKTKYYFNKDKNILLKTEIINNNK
ncbi:MAG: hypothetical protein WC123_07565 [Bacilli bacterium]